MSWKGDPFPNVSKAYAIREQVTTTTIFLDVETSQIVFLITFFGVALVFGISILMLFICCKRKYNYNLIIFTYNYY